MSVLHPQQREELLELLRPPEGYQLDQAVGTTFSLDLLALLVLPVGFTWMDLETGGTEAPTAEPLKVLEAVRSMADRITLFCQAGQIRLPRKHHKLFALLESAIVQATAPHVEGSLHAKTWALRYTGDGDTVRYRFICLSRNLTFDQSWDVVVTLEGDVSTTRKTPFRHSRTLRDFYEGLASCSVQPLSEHHARRLALVAKEIGLVDFIPFDPFDELEFFPMGLDGKSWVPLTQRRDHLFVVAPFLDKGFLDTVTENGSNPGAIEAIVSTPEAYDNLGSDALEHFTTHCLTVPQPQADESGHQLEAPPPTPAGSGAATPAGLHAKFYVLEQARRSTLLIGSANATKRAFERNVEFLVGLGGRSAKVGADALLDTGDSPTLRQLLVTHAPCESPDPTLQSRLKAERDLDRWCQRIAAWRWRIEVRQSPESAHSELYVSVPGSEPTGLPKGVKVTVSPAGLAASAPVQLDRAVSGMAFPIGAESEISAFLNVVASKELDGLTVRRGFSIPAELVGAPDGRLTRVVTSVITQHGGLVEWLFLMLGEESYLQHDGTGEPHRVGNGTRSTRRNSGWGLFEELARAAVLSPDRLKAAQNAVDQLGDQDLEDTDLPSIRDLLRRLTGGTE